MENRNVVIIGSGPAGYTSAIYASRAMLKPVLIAGREPGGQLMLTSEVENWPGEPMGVLGPELMEKLKKQAEKFGTEIIADVVTKVDFSARPYKVTTENGQEFLAASVIISTGASAMYLGVPGEDKLKGKGVSACATCDGFFFRGKEIAVIGGGDSAMEEATFLTRFATKVTVINRSEAFRASKFMLDKAKSNPKISFILDTVVEEVLGDEQIRALKLKNTKTGEVTEFRTQGMFVAIGHRPNTDIFKDKITLDKRGYILTEGKSTKTNVDGVFACGDVMDPWYRQAITAAGTGCQAALEAERFLAHG